MFIEEENAKNKKQRRDKKSPEDYVSILKKESGRVSPFSASAKC